METVVDTVQSKNRKLTAENKELKEELTRMKYGWKSLEMRMNDLEQYIRSNNIRIYGLEDKEKDETHENTTYTILNFLRNKLDISLKPSGIDIAHKLGKFTEKGNRSVICRFVSRMQRVEIMKKRKMLKGSHNVIRDDLT